MRRRAGYTLVEILVAMALIVFIMLILTEAFSAGADTFRRLKAIGDMNERLRATTTVLRRDIGAEHFEAARRMSDPTFTAEGPPKEGFFRVQGVPVGGLVWEGNDLVGVPSIRCTSHMLHFAMKLRGDQRQESLSAVRPGKPTLLQRPDQSVEEPTSTWAEVAYFLRPLINEVGVPVTVPGSGMQLFALHRRQLYVLPYADDLNNQLIPLGAMGATPPNVLYPVDVAGNANDTWRNYPEVSCRPDFIDSTQPDYATGMPPRRGFPYLHFNTERDLVLPQKRTLSFPPNWWPNTPASGQPSWPAYPPLVPVAVYGPFSPLPPPMSPPTPPPGNMPPEPPIRTPTPPMPDTRQWAYQSYPYLIGDRGESITQRGDDVLLSDVMSFTVRLLPQGSSTWVDIPDAPVVDAGPPFLVPFYDTGYEPSRGSAPVRAIQITLRVWDTRTQQARQVTFVQEL